MIRTIFCLIFSLSLSSTWAASSIIVKVGVVHFPPYIEVEADGKTGGMVMESRK